MTCVTIWRRGQVIPSDLPSGKYTIIYRVSKLVAGPAYIAARRMVGKAINIAGTDRAQISGYRVVDRWFSPSVDFQFDCQVHGAGTLAVLGVIAAIAVALGAVAIFTNATAVEIRKVLTTEAGQDWLSKAGGNMTGLLVIGGLALAGIAIAAVMIRRKAAL